VIEVFDAAKPAAQARRETVDYVRATLVILQQMPALAKNASVTGNALGSR
jgi:hypothetical protein